MFLPFIFSSGDINAEDNDVSIVSLHDEDYEETYLEEENGELNLGDSMVALFLGDENQEPDLSDSMVALFLEIETD